MLFGGGTILLSRSGNTRTPSIGSRSKEERKVMRKRALFSAVFLLGLLMAAGLALSGCGKAKGEAKPGIISLSPDSGEVGMEVVIQGSNFGKVQGVGTVHFGTSEASVVSWSDTSITVKVPADLAPATYGVTVVTEEGASNQIEFQLTQAQQQKKPEISSLSPTSGLPGSEVKVNGSNFGSTQGKGKILFGPGEADVISWSDTSITFKVPYNVSDILYGVKVETPAGKSQQVDFQVTQKPEQLEAQKEAVVGYLEEKGQSTAGSEAWKISLVKKSAQDPNWEVVKITLPDGNTFQALLIINQMAGAWQCLSTQGPPWSGVEFKGAPVPSDLQNV
jgi:hypothetical protein